MKGISFDNYHSYDDFNLILSEVDIPPATAKTTYVDIPGSDGSIDLTEALGEVRFNDRECKFTFTVLPSDNFEQKKTEVSNLLNGKRCKICVDKDPDYYWNGRCFVNEYASDRNLHKIVVGATVAPYKLKHDVTKVIVPAGEDVAVTLVNSRKSVIPTVTTTTEAEIIFNGNAYNINAGTHKILNLQLTQGEFSVTVTSTADVEFCYQEGDL